MGQKVNPHGLRVGVIKSWDSKWYADKKDFSDLLLEDSKIREYVKSTLFEAGISKVEIERAANKVKVSVYTAKPGMVIGRGGEGVEKLRMDLEKKTGKSIIVNVEEIKNPDLDAQLLAENIAGQLERRVAFRRAMKQTIRRVRRLGVEGIRTQVAGRLAGADMARTEGYSEGTIPLQTLRADIDYGFAEANTTYGKLGVKVWLYKGEVLPELPTKSPRNRRGRDRKDNRQRDGQRGKGRPQDSGTAR
ncbi:MAG: 30S ribosomal protein S3 [Tissierellia bacterium]|nr:30S ribosomal protein S3 [Tissierellia bacterium]